MHARVSTITGSPDQAEAGIRDFKENVVPWIKENGGPGGILLIDRGPERRSRSRCGVMRSRCAEAKRLRMSTGAV
jgi:hypothetical protein